MSHIEGDGVWLQEGPIFYRKKNGVLYVRGKGASIEAGKRVVCTLPEGYRPRDNQDALPVASVAGLSGSQAYIGVYSNGEVVTSFSEKGYLWTCVCLPL